MFLRFYIFNVSQATAALDEKSRLEKSLKDLQMVQGDQKVNIIRLFTTTTRFQCNCCLYIWKVGLYGVFLFRKIQKFKLVLSCSCWHCLFLLVCQSAVNPER